MKEIEELRSRRQEIEERTEKDTERLEQDIAAMQKRILDGGETSGDRITDYLLAAYGYIDHEISLPFRRIEEQLVGKTGQFFLVVVHSRVRHMFGGRFSGEEPRESDYNPETHYTLGILSDDKLVFDAKKCSCGLPTETYVELSFSSFDVPAERAPGPFLLVEGLRGLGKVIQDNHAWLEVLAGCEAVFSYSPPEFHSAPGERPPHWVIALNQAIRRLGRNIPEAPEEKVALDRERREVLAKLDEKRYVRQRLLDRTFVSPGDMEKIEKDLRSLLARAKGLGLEEEMIVLLVTAELKIAEQKVQ